MKRVLVTGASGFLGHFLVQSLLQNNDIFVVAVLGRPEDNANSLPKENPMLEILPCHDLFSKKIENIDTVVNCAFSRSNDYGRLSESLEFTSRLVNKLRKDDIKSVINISSQGVYKRQEQGILAMEDAEIEPLDIYSMAKYATEQIFFSGNLPVVTNVRMASINMPMRFLNIFVQKVKRGEPLTISTPKQPAALIDVHDAADALAALVVLDANKRAKIYNVGIGYQKNILDYAKEVVDIGKSLGFHGSIVVEDNDIICGAGMDCSRIMYDCKWKPKVSSSDMIRELFNV